MRRFLNQIVRAFSGFKYQTSSRRNADGTVTPGSLVVVPAMLASTDSMVAQILKNGSDNIAMTAPMIAVYQTGLTGRREALQNVSHVDTRLVTERAIDPETGKYTDKRGRSYAVERPMPRPFEMTVKVDIWTSNMDQKQQLAEQILTVFYPDILIQSSDNALDWTALTSMSIDDIEFTSRSFPIGTDELEIMSLTLKLPFWLSPPVKIQAQRIIEQIVANIYDAHTGADLTGDLASELTADNFLTRNIITPGDYSVRIENGKAVLLGPKDLPTDDDGNPNDWAALLSLYGALRPTISRIHLRSDPDLDDTTHDITGTIQLDENTPNELFFQLDLASLPENTLPPFDAVIDPRVHFPGVQLPTQHNGQSYMVLTSISAPSQAWGGLSAQEGDIISYANGQWYVSTRPSDLPAPQYVLNKNKGNQLRWTGKEWVLTLGGIYAPGMWRLHL